MQTRVHNINSLIMNTIKVHVVVNICTMMRKNMPYVTPLAQVTHMDCVPSEV